MERANINSKGKPIHYTNSVAKEDSIREFNQNMAVKIITDYYFSDFTFEQMIKYLEVSPLFYRMALF